MTRAWAWAVMALGAAPLACAAILGIDSEAVGAVDRLCRCPEVVDLLNVGKEGCQAELTGRFTDISDEVVGSWAATYADAGCDLCENAGRCLAARPVCEDRSCQVGRIPCCGGKTCDAGLCE